MENHLQDRHPASNTSGQTYKKYMIIPPLVSLPARFLGTSRVPPQNIQPGRSPGVKGQTNSRASISEIETQQVPAMLAPSPDSPQPAPRRRRLRRVPELRQVTAVECGPACLAMLLSYYGHAASISDVLQRCGVGRDGLSAFELVRAARLYGLRVRAISLELHDFRFVSLPAIVHWDFNHFVVVERWSSRYIQIIDPARGRRRVSISEFDEAFTGVVLLLEPGAHFQPQVAHPSLSLWSYLRLLLHMRPVLLQVLGASLLLQLLGLGAPLLTALVIDHVVPARDLSLLSMLLLGMLLLVLAQGTTSLLRTFLLLFLQVRLDCSLMLHFLEHLLSLPYRFFQLRLNGDLLARVNSNLKIRELLTSHFLSTILDGSSVLLSFFLLLSLSPLLTGITLLIGAVQVALLLITSPFLRRLTQRDLEAQGRTQGYLNEALSGIATLKAAGAEHRAFSRWENLFFEEMNVSLHLQSFSSVINIVSGVISGLTPLLLLWLGAWQVINGHLSVGTMLALNALANQFLRPLNSLAGNWEEVQIVQAHFARVSDVLDAQPEQNMAQVRPAHRLSGQVELRQVSFQYDQHAQRVLEEIALHIKPGQRVALVGKTGSGKSTLGKLLVGLITPSSGAILYDDVPLEQLHYQEVRRQCGVVLQESFIFSGSIKENIALNHPEMDLHQIAQAAQIAAIDADIQQMPMGYETMVSEGGSALSGGQRQRVALARAVAHHPALLLLDEATSALDVATEREVEQNLATLGCTQIIIAHRLSTIRNANLIVVLDQGRVVEQGTHEQLLSQNGFYAHLIQTQLRSGEITTA